MEKLKRNARTQLDLVSYLKEQNKLGRTYLGNGGESEEEQEEQHEEEEEQQQ